MSLSEKAQHSTLDSPVVAAQRGGEIDSGTSSLEISLCTKELFCHAIINNAIN